MKLPETSVVEQVVNCITRYSMLEPRQRVGVAVSGGPDSIALLHLLHALAPARGWTLHVLHVNHCLRGEESEADARFVAGFAASLGLPAAVERLPVPSGGNLEEEARRLRYAFFDEARRSRRLDRVALGHTRSDQAETVLFRLLRGSGVTGLAGIPPVTAGGIVRPMIEVDRADVLRYLDHHGLRPREDSSNEDLRFARNRIRHQLLPLLRREWNPELDAALARLAGLCRDEELYWESEAARLLEIMQSGARDAATAAHRHGPVILDVDRLAQLPTAACRRVLRAAAAKAKGSARGLDLAHVERLLDLVRRPRGYGRATLPGLEARRSFGRLRLAVSGEPPRRFRLPLPVPGEVRLPAGVRVRTELEEAPADSRYNGEGEALDWERVSGTLELRSWLPGDTFRPSGESQEYKIKDLFQQARIPSWERPEWPMVWNGHAVLWVRGFGSAAGFGASSGTRTLLRVFETGEDSGAA